MTGENTQSWLGYLAAHRKRRALPKAIGATSTDHGHPTARTGNLSQAEAATLYKDILSGDFSFEDAERFRAHMLTEMARTFHEDIAYGKGRHQMDQTHIGYTYWQQPDQNTMPPCGEGERAHQPAIRRRPRSPAPGFDDRRPRA